MEINLETLDLSGKKLKKLCKPTSNETQVTTLVLDDNELQRLDNIDSFTKVQKLSAVRNQLLRMHGVCRLHSLHTLNLANNGILTIEGLKDLSNLHCLNLAGNNIKTIEHLNTNINLEHIDLSENNITHIMDMSFLKNLKELLLHNNKIGHLRQCERFLPTSLVTLTLASNNISDLNEISQLVNLTNLKSISLANNPCVIMTGDKIGFDYRPFVINWCMNVQVIDGYVVDAIESLRGEWLYSQGRGRHYRVGDQQELSQYLSSVCPLTGEQLETEEDRKLRLILSKAQHHQQQLREQSETPTPPVSRKKLHGAKHSPRLNSSRLSNKSKSPDRMSSSCYNSSCLTDSPTLMIQSLDPNLLNQTVSSKSSMDSTNGFIEKCLDDSEPVNSPLQALSKLVPVPESLMSPDYRPSPLIGRISTPSTIPTPLVTSRPGSAKIAQPVKSPKFNRTNIAKPKNNVIVENKRNTYSPIKQRRTVLHGAQSTNKQDHVVQPVTKPLQSVLKKSSSSEEESEICDAKLHTIQMKVEERRHKEEMSTNGSGDDKGEKAEKAAVYIQKMWRGYYTRNCNKEVQEAYRVIQARRADEYILKLATDMESTKAALESERKIQVLQMQAINALWKKVSLIQPESGETVSTAASSNTLENSEVIKDLAQTCTLLQNQIQQLQGSMQDIVKFMSVFSQIPSINQHLQENAAATQTEIVAVHTPQGDAAKLFPFQKQSRPSSLPLPVNHKGKKENSNHVNQELRQFAGSLVDGVIKTVSETKADCFGTQTTEITVTDTGRKHEPEGADVALDNINVKEN